MYRKQVLNAALDKLGKEFMQLDLSMYKMDYGKEGDIMPRWPGPPADDVMVCVLKGHEYLEPFHRHDFFFINYAYKNSYEALSERFDQLITIDEDCCYIGQPYNGYALRVNNPKDEIIVIGVLIQRDAFFHEYLPVIYADAALFRFFVEPQKNKFSEEFIHLSLKNSHSIRSILELMVMEYANRNEDTQRFLKYMLQTLMLEIARRYRIEQEVKSSRSISEKIMEYMDSHSNVVTLKDISTHFSYHPNYISSVLHKETGRKFTEILLEKRMERAALLLRNTTLSVEEISNMLGYSNFSNFYKAFRNYYGVTPRDFVK